MSNNLLKQLEEKINTAIETIELSHMEITDLKKQNDELENRYGDWEERLSALIEKFEQLEEGEAVDIEAKAEATIQKVEEKSEEVEADKDEEIEAEEEDETEGPIFGTSVDSHTEDPGSAQHYA